ncbi:Endoribonuclease L-PSP [Novipirellula aureliae]|uniref:Endoribonuclease L-PSP n=1 Tax=Novipirellula aureliae TaxID=2527966 RepID=A0A5C6E3A3_9BACT|nr:RidA family protein [Novipirellula aureliae]TWU43358.1 Endoribonuclease L-PSP [Novipirellula aureliae]
MSLIDKGFAKAEKATDEAICFQMQPVKELLRKGGCNGDCQVEALLSTPQMPPCVLSQQQHTVVHLDHVCRVALMITPQPIGSPVDQAWEAISTMRVILKQQAVEMTVAMQTVFVASEDDIPAFKKLFEAYFGDRAPATSFIIQPPCEGQALAIEAWAVGSQETDDENSLTKLDIQYPLPNVVTVAYDSLRWIYVAGVTPSQNARNAYDESASVFGELANRLESVGACFSDVPRVWLYQGGITELEEVADGSQIERYRELNRARTDFFDKLQDLGQMAISGTGSTIYPASTGIGMQATGLTLSAMALQTNRDDVKMLSLENPQQTSAFDYAKTFSAKSPKFARAMAVRVGDYVTTWVSGTASILNSESAHLGDIEKQTEQTIDNIEQLISRDNFKHHGMDGCGAGLSDLAKIRVYVKREADYRKCREVCERRFRSVPTIYAIADVCRGELLVEIEGVAFSKVE